jgi:hypothetical protein
MGRFCVGQRCERRVDSFERADLRVRVRGNHLLDGALGPAHLRGDHVVREVQLRLEVVDAAVLRCVVPVEPETLPPSRGTPRHALLSLPERADDCARRCCRRPSLAG